MTTAETAAGRRWDAVVIGAGPAGCLTARELARRGRSVLLVERSRLPRWKVCGACLGSAGLRALAEAGLGDLPGSIGARPVRRALVRWRGRIQATGVPGMVIVSRRALDHALAEAARRAGATVLEGFPASWDADGAVRIGETPVEARTVVIAAGLRSALRRDGARVETDAWIGLGCSDATTPRPVEPGELLMCLGRHGYAGCVVTEDGAANWAAAVDPAFVRRHGSAADAVRAVCREAGLDADPPEDGWAGTPALTRAAPAQTGRVYRVGDAAGYVEPITGEGMSWALLGAASLARVLDRALATDRHDGAWTEAHAALLRRRRARCRVVARGLRSPAAVHAAMLALRAAGPARTALVGRLVGSAA